MMTNAELKKGVKFYDRKAYSLYLRRESLMSLLDPNYKQDKSFESYGKSKFCSLAVIDYSEYICESIDSQISYTDYLAQSIQNNISYTEYIS